MISKSLAIQVLSEALAPGADYVIREGDVVVILGKDEALVKLRKK